jgi:hypothetical protein
MDLIVTAYTVYIPVMIALTIWVAGTIHKNTSAFLLEIFPDHEKVAGAVNNLLQVGFYLIALGFGFLRLQIKYSPSFFGGETDPNAKQFFMQTSKQLVEELATKLGGFTLFVGFLLFLNLLIMLGLRKNMRNARIREEQIKYFKQAQAQAYQHPTGA